MKKRTENILFILRLASIPMVLFPVIVLFSVNLRSGEDIRPIGALIMTLAYFTVQTNLFALAWNLSAVTRRLRNTPRGTRDSLFRWASAVYITVTCLVYHVLLRPSWNPQGIMVPVNFLLHYAVPILFIADWIVSERPGSTRVRSLPLLLVYPLVYLAGAVVFGHLTGIFVYPFINLAELGLIRFIINAAGLAAGFAFLGTLYCGIDRLKEKTGWAIRQP